MNAEPNEKSAELVGAEVLAVYNEHVSTITHLKSQQITVTYYAAGIYVAHAYVSQTVATAGLPLHCRIGIVALLAVFLIGSAIAALLAVMKIEASLTDRRTRLEKARKQLSADAQKAYGDFKNPNDRARSLIWPFGIVVLGGPIFVAIYAVMQFFHIAK